MALEVKIEKRLASYTLSLDFCTGEGCTVDGRKDDGALAVLGPSGAGKTMTLRCIAGLERPDSGRIVLNDRVLFDSAKNINIASRDRRVALLFQNYALFPHLSVAENIAFGLDRLSRGEQNERVARQIRALHLDGLASRFPPALSGGEQQRVALARALAIEPDALLLDEPLAALDTHLRSQIEQQLLETLGQFHGATLFVTHNIEEAYRIGSEMMVLSKGRAEAFGPKEEIFRHPASLVVAQLTGCKNISRAKLIDANTVDAIDWGCRLRIGNPIGAAAAHVGIRAHHIDFVDSGSSESGTENTFPCWLVSASETPFRITLFLKLHSAPQTGDAPSRLLQAEVFKEKWQRFKDTPMPWRVRLAPETLFTLPD